MEQICTAELRQAKAELAHANAERDNSSSEWLRWSLQQKLQRKARSQWFAFEQETDPVSLGLGRLMTRASNETEEVAQGSSGKQQGEEMQVLQATHTRISRVVY